MKFHLLSIPLLFMGILSGTAFADSLEDYSKFKKENYYLLDDQPFSKIECKIRVPSIDQFLATVKQQFEAIPGKVVIEENVKDFSLIYTKGQGVSFKKPTFNIKALEQEKVQNQENFSQGVQKMELGLKDQIDGVGQVLLGLFDEYTISNKKKIQEFSRNETGVEVTTEGINEKVISREKYSGSSRTSEFTSSTMTGVEQSKFEKIDNYLVLSESNVQLQLKQSGEIINMIMQIGYDKLNKIVFPKNITSKTVIQVNVLKQETAIDVFLDSCTVE